MLFSQYNFRQLSNKSWAQRKVLEIVLHYDMYHSDISLKQHKIRCLSSPGCKRKNPKESQRRKQVKCLQFWLLGR